MNEWRLKQQTNGNAITVDGEKPMLDNSIDKVLINIIIPKKFYCLQFKFLNHEKVIQ